MTDLVWGKRVSATLLYERETDVSEAAYVATTMGGTPGGAVITVEDSDSKDGVIRRLREALEVMGFSGRVFVHDVTEPGESLEYEV